MLFISDLFVEMDINILYVNALLLACVASSCVAIKCNDEQFLMDNRCQDCTRCSKDYRVVEQCTNTTDTICSKICKEYEIPNAGYGCDINCDYCERGKCDDLRLACKCDDGYFGDICDRRAFTTSAPTTQPTETHRPENDSGNRVLVIVLIVVAIIAAVIVIIGIIFGYVACSRRSSHGLSESSDESTGSFHSSNSINSRTMLTDRSSQSPHRQTTSSLQRDTILPPPKSWNKFTIQ